MQDHVKEGRLVHVLSDWSAPASGYYLYYPSRRQPTPAFVLLVNTLRYRKEPASAQAVTAIAPLVRSPLRRVQTS